MQTGEILPKTEIETKDGRWFYVSHCPVTDEKGKTHFSVVVATDITDIKNTQQKLMEYQEELKKRIKELEDFYDMSVSRELKMIELKKEIAELKEELSKYKKG
jgi:peptidoglycan hydrolase CwlO-like protein